MCNFLSLAGSPNDFWYETYKIYQLFYCIVTVIAYCKWHAKLFWIFKGGGGVVLLGYFKMGLRPPPTIPLVPLDNGDVLFSD